MQSRIRKKRCFKRVEWARKASIACISVILFSCSHVNTKKSDLEQMSLQIRNLCLTGEGRGRIKLLSKTALFSYESVNDIKNKNWKLGADIPLHGSELLELDWGRVDRTGAKLKGNFARRIYVTLRNHENSKENLSNLKSFANGFAQLIYLKENMDQNNSSLCSKKSCKIGNKELLWNLDDGHLVFDYKGHDNHSMRFEFSNLTPEGPKRLSIYPLENKLNSNSFKLEFFFNSCE